MSFSAEVPDTTITLRASDADALIGASLLVRIFYPEILAWDGITGVWRTSP
jgi:hypothetical protein